ncbi:MAG: hypothetical protein ACLTAO_13550, partial [Christensenellales bacterium]
SSVDLCRRGANPLAKIALSKSDDEQWRTRLKELAEDTDAPLTDIADELRAIAAKIGQSAEENAEDEEVVRQHEAVVAKQYAAVCDENELTKRLVQMRAAGGGAYEEYVKLLDELAEAKRVEPLMKEYGTARTASGALEARVAEIMHANPKLSRAQAVVRAYQIDPDIPEVL